MFRNIFGSQKRRRWVADDPPQTQAQVIAETLRYMQQNCGNLSYNDAVKWMYWDGFTEIVVGEKHGSSSERSTSFRNTRNFISIVYRLVEDTTLSPPEWIFSLEGFRSLTGLVLTGKHRITVKIDDGIAASDLGNEARAVYHFLLKRGGFEPT